MRMKREIIQGDCLNVLKTLSDNSVDSIVTDPPYELGFMGKAWDNTGIAYSADMWREALRVLKPGGHLLSFGGSRTYHRMACAIEDAGFEIRDMVEWIYGSGFPKSLNIGKAVDKLQGNEREDLGHNPSARINKPNVDVYEAGIRGKDCNITKGTSEWEGYGTALKPAHEPVCMARKPLSEKTVALNVIKWGTGGVNIDGCRVGLNGEPNPSGSAKRVYEKNQYTDKKIYGDNKNTPNAGRFPANLIHDGSDEVVALFPHSAGQQGDLLGHNKNRQSPNGCFGKMGPAVDHLKRNDSGSAARFFYCAKASKAERNRGCEALEAKRSGSMIGCIDNGNFLTGSGNPRQGINKNNHPTVKPIALMRYLVKLITPPKGIVLDLFAGSGSTLIAAQQLDYGFIGIELNPEYIKIAEKRLANTMVNQDLFK